MAHPQGTHIVSQFQMTASRDIRLFIADDSFVLRQRLLEWLRDVPHVQLLGCAENGLHAVNCIRMLQPDIVVLDIQMPLANGMDVLKSVQEDDRRPVMIVFTNFPYPQYRCRALEYGAAHFFDKTTEFEKLRELFENLALRQSTPEFIPHHANAH
jgi:DNA-binding NarL/FixJ family response regulator